MRISELCRTTGVPLATVKFYLREGLLPSGRPTAATQAEYDDSHVRRLRLVRALVEIGGLPLASVRAVLEALDAGPGASLAAVATAHDALPPTAHREREPVRARAVLRTLGWHVHPDSSAVHRLDAALEALEGVGLAPGEAQVRTYADAALSVARADVASVPDGSAADMVELIVTGTMLYEPLLLALRRMAQQHLFVTGPPVGD
jgi:DNA-binding transcriptional MerR regulator